MTVYVLAYRGNAQLILTDWQLLLKLQHKGDPEQRQRDLEQRLATQYAKAQARQAELVNTNF